MARRREFDRVAIFELLTSLGARLDARGVHGSVYVVGGAAIAATLDDGRRVTSDIDALVSPADVIAVEASQLAIERDLPLNWLNSSAAAWIPPSSSDIDATTTAIPGLTVTIASPRHLLAMKLAAFRIVDRSDLVRLFEHLDIQTPEAAADIVDEVYGVDSLANPGRDESILSARSVLAAAKASPRPTGRRGGGQQRRSADGRFAPSRRDEAAFELDVSGE